MVMAMQGVVQEAMTEAEGAGDDVLSIPPPPPPPLPPFFSLSFCSLAHSLAHSLSSLPEVTVL